MLLIILIWISFVGLIACWAHQWGRDWLAWAALSLFLSPLVSGIALAVSGENEDAVAYSSCQKKCPFCAEWVKEEALKCKHCGAEIISTKGAEYLSEKDLNALIAKLKK